MPGAVRAYLRHWSASVYASVPVDNVMVADTLPATRFVPAVYIAYGVVASLCGRATVYYNLVYLSHLNIRFGVLAGRTSYVCSGTSVTPALLCLSLW